ncbi:MAG TPA: GH25 family lysozyme [Polyangiaceae bacterium]|jgi:GH25 family lysozyme M1 (1,4-beta-N-acetylmuramidase)
MIEGIDVSGWSGNLDLEAIAGSKAFVYHQATDGVGTVDKMLIPRTNALRGVGMGNVIGVYHFLRVRHGMKQDADEQCKQHLDARANAGGVLPTWLDVELGEPNSSNRAATHDEVRAAVELFVETWQRCLGGALVGYSSPGEMAVMGLDKVDAFTSLPLALAEYNGGKPPTLPAPYTAWLFHQWAGDVQAYRGIVDCVRFNGTIDDLLNAA